MALTKISRGLLNTGVSDSSDATAITITSNENVLIGSTAEIASNIGLQVTGTDAAGFISLFRDDSSVVADDDLGGILFYGDDNNATTQFASLRATAEGTHADGDNPTALRFLTTSDGAELSAERMRITNDGKVGMGVTSPADYLFSNPLAISAPNGSNSGLTIVSATNANGTLAMADGTSGVEQYRGFVQYSHLNEAMFIGANGATVIRLDSDGVKFGSDSAAANALDDYEEGNWTPASSSNGTVSNAQGFYVKIGKMVHVLFYFSLSGASISSSVDVSGLPFAVQDNLSASNVGGTGAIFGDSTNFLAFGQEASSLLTIEYDRPLSGTPATSANLRGSVTYMTAL